MARRTPVHLLSSSAVEMLTGILIFDHHRGHGPAYTQIGMPAEDRRVDTYRTLLRNMGHLENPRSFSNTPSTGEGDLYFPG